MSKIYGWPARLVPSLTGCHLMSVLQSSDQTTHSIPQRPAGEGEKAVGGEKERGRKRELESSPAGILEQHPQSSSLGQHHRTLQAAHHLCQLLQGVLGAGGRAGGPGTALRIRVSVSTAFEVSSTNDASEICALKDWYSICELPREKQRKSILYPECIGEGNTSHPQYIGEGLPHHTGHYMYLLLTSSIHWRGSTTPHWSLHVLGAHILNTLERVYHTTLVTTCTCCSHPQYIGEGLPHHTGHYMYLVLTSSIHWRGSTTPHWSLHVLGAHILERVYHTTLVTTCTCCSHPQYIGEGLPHHTGHYMYLVLTSSIHWRGSTTPHWSLHVLGAHILERVYHTTLITTCTCCSHVLGCIQGWLGGRWG